jgi:glycine amidinotransferase
LLINPEFVDEDGLPEFLKGWEVIVAPKPETFSTLVGDYRVVSDWMSLNILSLDKKRVIVEEKQKTMIETLKAHGFEPIPCPFESYYIFGGSFHCATLDIRRRRE